MTTPAPHTVSHHRPFIASEARDFGLRDPKGRALGCAVRIWPVDFVAAPLPTEQWAVPQPRVPGRVFRIHVYATRNGEQFGAGGSTFDFPTETLARAAAEKKVAACRARYVKQFGAAVAADPRA